MHQTIARSKRFEDLLDLQQHDLPYAFDSIFKREGFFARRLSVRKYKVLKNIDGRLRAMLEPGERVRFLTFGADLSFWESYFLGFAGYLTNRRAIVLTDRRILMVQIDWKERPKDLHTQIRYPSIESVKRSGIGNTVLRLDDGTKRVIQGMPKADRKLLMELSDNIRQVIERDGTGVEDLCPHCFAVVAERPARCAVCGGAFKSARTAALRSLVFPGLGDFYLGHWKFAIWETLIIGFIWLSMLLTILLPSPDYPVDPATSVVTAAMIVLFFHVPDALLTRYIGRKGIYPKGGRVGARVAVRHKAAARVTTGVGA